MPTANGPPTVGRTPRKKRRTSDDYSPSEIVALFDSMQDEPGHAALLIGLWKHWPTIREALLAYDAREQSDE